MWKIIKKIMKKINRPKIRCFHHKKHIDILCSNISFKADYFTEILKMFPNQTLIAVIDADIDMRQWLSVLDKDKVKTDIQTLDVPVTSVAMAIEKEELMDWVGHVFDFSPDLFLISIKDGSVSDELLDSVKVLGNSMVKKGLADIDTFFNIPENEIEMSIDKSQYAEEYIISKLYSIFES